MIQSSPESAVHLQEVVFGWRPGEPVLSIETLSIAGGERTFIFGPSGCGKSTLLGLIAGVLRPRCGEVAVLGQSLSAMAPGARDRFRAEHMGVIFQMFNLLPFLSVGDNVRLGCRFSRRRHGRASGQAGGLDGEVNRLLSRLGLPDGLSSRPVTALSVGQQQRVAVARALIGRPDLVIADEPTSALDADARDRFIDLLVTECEAAGSTLIFVSHDMSLARHFGRTLDLTTLNTAVKAAEARV